MDPALIKQRDAFKMRAMAMPTVEKRKPKEIEKERPSKKMRRDGPKQSLPKKEFDYKSVTASSQNKFGILAKIVKYMKDRHQAGEDYPLTVEEILDETNQLDIPQRHKHWLVTEALSNNPKIEVIESDKYLFRSKFKLKDKRSLLRLLDKHDQNGLGGILRDDVDESLPNSTKAIKLLGDHITSITRQDKKQILFYNDKSSAFTVDEELQKLWRGVTVEGVDERKIEEYLHKQGISSMQDIEVKKATAQKTRRNNKKQKIKSKDNEHMSHILKDYSTDK